MTIIRCVVPLVALVTWNASLASAQRNYCDASQFNALTNMWKVQPDQNTSQVPASELPAERKIMRRVLEMFQSAFVPTGAAGLDCPRSVPRDHGRPASAFQLKPTLSGTRAHR